MSGSVDWLVSLNNSAYHINIIAGTEGYVFASKEYKNSYSIPMGELNFISTPSLAGIGRKLEEGTSFKLSEIEDHENASEVVVDEL